MLGRERERPGTGRYSEYYVETLGGWKDILVGPLDDSTTVRHRGVCGGTFQTGGEPNFV